MHLIYLKSRQFWLSLEIRLITLMIWTKVIFIHNFVFTWPLIMQYWYSFSNATLILFLQTWHQFNLAMSLIIQCFIFTNTWMHSIRVLNIQTFTEKKADGSLWKYCLNWENTRLSFPILHLLPHLFSHWHLINDFILASEGISQWNFLLTLTKL